MGNVRSWCDLDLTIICGCGYSAEFVVENSGYVIRDDIIGSFWYDFGISNSSSHIHWLEKGGKKSVFQQEEDESTNGSATIEGVRIGCKVGLQNGKPQQCRIIVRTRDLPPVALLLSQRAAEVAMVTDRRKPEPTLPFSWMQAPDVSLSCVKWFSCTVLQLLLLLLLLFFFLFFLFCSSFASSPTRVSHSFRTLLSSSSQTRASPPIFYPSPSPARAPLSILFISGTVESFERMGQGEIRSRRGGDGEIRLSKGNGIDRYNENTEGWNICRFAWMVTSNWDRSKRIFQVDVWNIKTPMVDILGDGENFRKLGEEFSKNSWNKHFVAFYILNSLRK